MRLPIEDCQPRLAECGCETAKFWTSAVSKADPARHLQSIECFAGDANGWYFNNASPAGGWTWFETHGLERSVEPFDAGIQIRTQV